MPGPARGLHVAFLAPMRVELRPLVRALSLRRTSRGGASVFAGGTDDVEVTAGIAGVGTVAAARATERLLDGSAIDHVVVVGVAGGVAPGACLGDVVVPDVVVDAATGREYRPARLGDAVPSGTLVTTDELLVDPDALGGLARRGVVALDMETAAVAAVCEGRGVPWSVFRAISDMAGDPAVDAAVLGLVRPDGTANLAAVARFLVARPARVRDLARLARDMRAATRAATAAALRALPRQ